MQPPLEQVPAPQLTPQAPQLAVSASRFVSQPSAGAPLQSANPGAHVMPHWLPSQVAIAFAGAGQGAQLVPHVSVLMSLAQALPQA
jgi:hypothetical protein